MVTKINKFSSIFRIYIIIKSQTFTFFFAIKKNLECYLHKTFRIKTKPEMKKIGVFIVSILLILSSCNNKKQQVLKPEDLKTKFEVKIPNNNKQHQKTKQVQHDSIDKCNIVEKYNLPLPFELLNTEILGPGDFSQLTPPANSSSFVNITKASFYTGVYLSDLVYCLVYDQKNYFLQYYDAIINLTKYLSIDQNFTSLYISKFQQTYRTDSVKAIVEQAIIKTCNFLENTNQISILPFLLIGSWTESMYLITGNALNNPSPDPKLLQIISNQTNTIDNLKLYIENTMLDVASYKLSIKLQTLENQLDTLKNIYNQIYISNNYLIDEASLQVIHNAFDSLKLHYLTAKHQSNQ